MAREHYIDDQNYLTVNACDLREGDVLSYANPRWNLRIDKVSTTRDGQIRVNLGDDGLATEWYEADERIQILPR